MQLVLVLSGAVGSGKSTIALAVQGVVSALRISTRALIIARKGVPSERLALQCAGDELDGETGFEWVAADVEAAARTAMDEVIIVDAVRRREQIEYLRTVFGDRVRHVHAVASDEELRRRHRQRQHDVAEPENYELVQESLTEQAANRLASVADTLLDVTRLDPSLVAAAALAGTGLGKPRTIERLVDVLVGGQYGSEGKGNVCSFIAPDYEMLLRVGGPNAGHIVYEPYFKFAQLPSGSLHNPAASLVIGPAATLSLTVLFDEIRRLKEAGLVITPDRLAIDPQAMVIEPGDIEWESQKLGVIGSTKQGVGSATARKILGRGGDGSFGPPVRLAKDVAQIAPFIRPTFVELENAFAQGQRILVEGTQGTDLSLHHGMWPHVTSRETTAAGCLADAGIAPIRVRDVIMVTRTYPIRVGGTSGYMGIPVDPEELARRSGLPVEDIRKTETGTISGNPRRIAEFDLGQVRRSAALNGATVIALTFADYLGAVNREARSLDALTAPARRRVLEIEEATGVRVGLISVGPGRSNIIDRREV